jgi:GrpB-like predicted nucleotidyltransferase (UPF0157 family)
VSSFSWGLTSISIQIMLTKNQETYLNTVPENKIAHVAPFDPATQTTAEEITSEIKSRLPIAKVFYIGSSKLGIAGENDIDMTILGEADFDNYFEVFSKLYGTPEHTDLENKYVKWEFVRNGFPVELHLNAFMTPNFQEQIDTQEILENNKDLRLEYEQIKLNCNGISWKEYLIKKYEFWNRVLVSHDFKVEP